jgi:choloylglycine hydrolase
MRSATLWTAAYDTKNRSMQYHTQHNRRVRQVDLKKCDFTAKELLRLPLNKEKMQNFDDVSPATR